MCKHIIAVGLEILEENYEEHEVADTIHLTKNHPLLHERDFYGKVFAEAEAAQQRALLRQLFQKNQDLRAQFLHFLEDKKPPVNTTDIIKIRDKVNDLFSNLDLDLADYYERSHYGGHDYYDEGEGGDQWAEEQLSKKLEPYFKKVNAHLQRGNLMQAMPILLGVFEGINNVEPPVFNHSYHEPFEPDDYDEHLKDFYKTQLSETSEILKNSIHPEAAVKDALDLVFSRHLFYTENPDSREHPMVYDFSVFQDLLLALLNSEATARHLLKILRQQELMEEYDFRRVVQRIADLTEDDNLWEKTARRAAPQDANIAIELLTFYLEKEQQNEFLQTAKQLFSAHAYELSQFLLEEMSATDDHDFYVEVLAWHTKRHRSISHFTELKSLVSPGRLNRFINSVEKWEKIFIVQMLEIEQDYEEIFEIASRSLSDKNFAELVHPVVAVFPNCCFELLTKKHKNTLMDNRGRDVYRVIAKELELLLQVEKLKMKTRIFAQGLVGQYARLRALKEELKWRGLV